MRELRTGIGDAPEVKSNLYNIIRRKKRNTFEQLKKGKIYGL